MFIFAFVLIIFISPLTAWYGEHQQSAEQFQTATVVEDATSVVNGYVAVSGIPTVEQVVTCETATNTQECVYQKIVQEKYTEVEKTHCGDLSSNQFVIEQLQQQDCDSAGENCKPCYRVNEQQWDVQSTTEDTATFAIGAYSLAAGTTPRVLLANTTKTYNNAPIAEFSAGGAKLNDTRSTITWIPANTSVLLAAESNNGILRDSGNAPFILSAGSYAATLAELELQDTMLAWVLRIVSFISMVAGVTMLAKPLTAFSNVFRLLPIVGKHIDNGIDGLVRLVFGIIGALVWVVLWLLIVAITYWQVVLVCVLCVAVFLVVVIWKGKKSAAIA